MDERRRRCIDGNEAAASVAYRASEVIAIYPITPASPMGELADEWAAAGRPNVWGGAPQVVEMQSEGGAAGAMHGALQGGALTTTFTASQGLLLMIPNLYKIAGELTPICMHVAARTVATHALSIFCDHSDVMACRQTGFAMLASASVQEAHDLAAVGHAATLRARVPFLHFFDGFRTSHEIAKVTEVADADLLALLDPETIAAHRARALTPDRPVLRGTAQNPDAFFQAREAANPYYEACPGVVREVLETFARLTGRRYRLFDYFGHPEATRVVVLMGSGVETARETAEWLAARGERVGVVAVRLYRPFSVDDFLAALPASATHVAVLDRTKEPGAVGEPLYQDVVAALAERDRRAVVLGGRYGLGSKELTPAMVKAVFDALAAPATPRHFTVGIVDDVTHCSLPVDEDFVLALPDVVQAVFWGLGADGTVGANKNSIKIIGEETENEAQGYFVYDSKKAGAVTISHLRFGPRPIRAPYLVQRAAFVGVHHFAFFDRYDVLATAAPGAVLLVNAPLPPEAVWDALPREAQETIVERGLALWTIDASTVAEAVGMGRRINTVMQTCFFAISGVLPRDLAIAQIKRTIEKTYARKGREVVARNLRAVDTTLAQLHQVPVPAAATATRGRPDPVPADAPDFVQRVTAVLMAGRGDRLPVSAFPVDGTWPVGTSRWEKAGIAREIPVWDPAICIQCNKCALICPHAAIRPKIYEPERLAGAPATFKSTEVHGSEWPGARYTLQVAPEDCTGCHLCVEFCPVKDKANPRHKAIDMAPQAPLREAERANWSFFLDLPNPDRTRVRPDNKGSQLLEPLFEYSGACAGCGETPYLKLLTQLLGDRIVVANATGCSSIYGGNLPTTPWSMNAAGRGPAWSNSLFEDNAEFGLGLRLAVDGQRAEALRLLGLLASAVGEDLAAALAAGSADDDAAVVAQRARVETLRERLGRLDDPHARLLSQIADHLVEKSVWIVGGDGWAYDIGFGGLDHVLSLDRRVNVLVLDTEVYSNTGGQASKATPLAAAAKFATAGKAIGKKDLGLEAISYGHVYVARVALGARDQQTVRAFREAASYPGPSLIIAYSHCIAHGYDLRYGARQQRLAVESGAWPLYRYDPRRVDEGKPAFQLDSPPADIPLVQYMRQEARFRMVEKADPARFRALLAAAQRSATDRAALYRQLAGLEFPHADLGAAKSGA
jgi:pyruvate-ferredoxin/flavodoxin oxidoreductase